jgi:hypothetical protein
MPKIHIWYKTSGQIVAVGRPSEGSNCIPLAGEDQSVLETDVEETQIDSLHLTHIVDPRQQSVVKLESTQ